MFKSPLFMTIAGAQKKLKSPVYFKPIHSYNRID